MGFVAGNPTTRAFSEMAEAYVALSRPARRLLAMAGLQPGEGLLDVGCGPGTVAAAAAELVGNDGQVVAIDLAPGMLARARQVAAGLENVAVLPMDARALAFSGASFEVVVANSVVQFTGPSSMAEWKRVLRPGGRLACSFPFGSEVWTKLCLRFVERIRDPLRTEMTARLATAGVVPDPAKARARLGFDSVACEVEQVVRKYRSAEDAFADEHRHGARIFLEALPADALAEFTAAYIEAVGGATGAEIPFQFHFWCFR
jgi:SAM-dependent methyltransferase